MRIRNLIVGLCLGTASLVAPQVAQAASITYTFDTSMLGPFVGTYSLDFQLTSPSFPVGTGNTATITNVGFGGGSASGTNYYPSNGGVTGSLTALPLTLSVNDFFNSVTADFTPGSLLTFDLDLTNLASAGFPDQFTFAILLDGFELSTTDPNGTNKLLVADLGGPNGPTVVQYALTAATAAPEPRTSALLVTGLVLTFLLRRQRPNP